MGNYSGNLNCDLAFFPKILAIVLVVVQKRAKEFGGLLSLLLSTMVEIICSALLAPIRMIFHSKFVLIIIAGRSVEWKTQQRTDLGTSWSEALHFLGSGMFLGVMWSLVVLLVVPSFFWWLTPILLALIVSIPLSVWSSRSTIGRKFQQRGLFLTPEEISPSPELHGVDQYQQEYQSSSSPLPVAKEHGFIRAVIEPCVHVLHLSLLRKERLYCLDIQTKRKELRDKTLSLGPDSLTITEKKALLCDPSMLRSLHKDVWTICDETLARKWGVIIGHQHRFPLYSHQSFDEMAVVKTEI